MGELKLNQELLAGLLKALGGFDVVLDFAKASDTAVHHNVARPYENMQEGTALQEMDEHLKIATIGAVKLINKILEKERSWDRVVSTLVQSEAFDTGGEDKYKSSSRTWSNTHWFKHRDQHDNIRLETRAWFDELVSDPDVRVDNRVDLEAIEALVAHAGAKIKDFKSVIFATERHELPVLDIGILRYPDPDTPYIKLYRIEILAWCKSTTAGLYYSSDESGLTGNFHVRRFTPRENFAAQMSEESKNKALQEYEKLFSG